MYLFFVGIFLFLIGVHFLRKFILLFKTRRFWNGDFVIIGMFSLALGTAAVGGPLLRTLVQRAEHSADVAKIQEIKKEITVSNEKLVSLKDTLRQELSDINRLCNQKSMYGTSQHNDGLPISCQEEQKTLKLITYNEEAKVLKKRISEREDLLTDVQKKIEQRKTDKVVIQFLMPDM